MREPDSKDEKERQQRNFGRAARDDLKEQPEIIGICMPPRHARPERTDSTPD